MNVEGNLSRSPGVAVIVAGVCSPFIVSGFMKAANFSGAVGEMEHFDLPLPALTAAAVIALQLGGSAMAVFASGLLSAIGALALAVFTVAATCLAHAFWQFTGPEYGRQLTTFTEHMSIAFGLLCVALWRLETAGILGSPAIPGTPRRIN